MKCPVCAWEHPSMLCPRCGFDSSRDYEKYPSFGIVGKIPAVSALRREWEEQQKPEDPIEPTPVKPEPTAPAQVEKPRKKLPWLAIAACAATLAVGILVGAGMDDRKPDTSEPGESVLPQTQSHTSAQVASPATTSDSNTANVNEPLFLVTNFQWTSGCSGEYASIDIRTISVSFSEWFNDELFSEADILISTPTNDTIAASEFLMNWNGEEVSISPSSSLPYGIYHIRFGTPPNADATISVLYGCEGQVYLESQDGGWYEFKFQNWKNERYLVQSEQGLVTSADYSAVTEFIDSYSMCGLIEDATGYAITTSDAPVPFKTASNVAIVNGKKKDLFTFEYDGWYLASDQAGTVYLTKALSDTCYWCPV